MSEIDRANKNAEFYKVMLELKDKRIRIQEDTIRILRNTRDKRIRIQEDTIRILKNTRDIQSRTIMIQTGALIIITIINLSKIIF